MSEIARHRRAAPSPLVLHLSQAASLMQQALLCAPADQNAPPQAEIATAAAGELRAMLDGIDIWQRHPYRRAPTDAPVIWSDGATQLRDHGAGAGRPILVIPSLINRADILDLLPEQSFLGMLAAEGFRPLLLDWGAPGAEENGFTLDDYADRRLRPALAISRVLAAGPVPVIGYCMGGALATAAAQRLAGDVSALVTLGTPWDCAQGIWMTRAGQSVLGPNAAQVRATLHAITHTLGALPHDILQTAFASLDPGLALRKFAQFARIDPDCEAATRFVAVEDWLNAQVHLPGPVAETLLIDWQLHNHLAKGQWELLGGPIQPEAVRCPTLSFCATQDRIAPPDNAGALPATIPGAQVERPETGHVGLIVGRAARRDVIAPIARFLHKLAS